MFYGENQVGLVLNHVGTVPMLLKITKQLSRRVSRVKWKRENKGSSEKSQGLAIDNPISPHKSLNNGQTMAIVHQSSSLRHHGHYGSIMRSLSTQLVLKNFQVLPTVVLGLIMLSTTHHGRGKAVQEFLKVQITFKSSRAHYVSLSRWVISTVP